MVDMFRSKRTVKYGDITLSNSDGFYSTLSGIILGFAYGKR